MNSDQNVVITLQQITAVIEVSRAIVNSDHEQMSLLIYALVMSAKACNIEMLTLQHGIREAWKTKMVTS